MGRGRVFPSFFFVCVSWSLGIGLLFQTFHFLMYIFISLRGKREARTGMGWVGWLDAWAGLGSAGLAVLLGLAGWPGWLVG